MRNLLLVFLLIATSTAVIFLSSVHKKPPASTLTQYTHPLATWVWQKTDPKSLVVLAQKHHVQTIYYNINPVLELLRDPNKAKLKTYENELIELAKVTGVNGISLQALTGSPDWITSEKHSLLTTITAWVTSFNSTSPVFSGIHYTLEPTALPNFEQNKKVFYKQYLETLNILIDQTLPYRHSHPEFTFALDLPTGLDLSIANSVFSKLYQIPNSQVILLAYYNTPEKTISSSKPFITLAKNKSPLTKILIGQQTEKDPSTVNGSYFGQSRLQLYSSLDIIYSNFSTYSNFSGLAIHSLSGLSALP